LTLAEAKKFAGAIASNGNITALSLMGGKQGLFREEGTFECVFDAVLNGGAVKGLQLTLLSFNDIVKRSCCADSSSMSSSNLATNTTLKELELNIIRPDTSQVADEGMEQLANVLRVNRGLEKIDICGGMMTNMGRRYLLESLRDNITLLKLETRRLPLLIDPLHKEERIEHEEGILLQSQINRHLEWNRIYRRCDENNNNNNNNNRSGRRTISLDIYPDLLEELANKPAALFLFLRNNNPQLFDSFSERNQKQRRRRSMRVLKKRRISEISGSGSSSSSSSERNILDSASDRIQLLGRSSHE